MNKEYIINGKIYKVIIEKSSGYLRNDETNSNLFFIEGNNIKKSLISILNFYNIKPDINNILYCWKDLSEKQKKKVNNKLKSIKTELMGIWMSDFDRYNDWVDISNNAIIKINNDLIYIKHIYPSIINKSTYNHL